MSNVTETINSLNYILNRNKQIRSHVSNIKDYNEGIRADIEKYQHFVGIIQKSRNHYKEIIDLMYEDSVGDLKKVVDATLKHIFYDKDYSLNVVLDDKRGTKTLSFVLVDNDSGMEVDLKDGVGNGIRCVISFVIHTFYLINRDSNILILDEAYSHLSASYISRFFEFAKRICVDKDFLIVLITHDERFIPLLDRIYYVSDGVINCQDGI